MLDQILDPQEVQNVLLNTKLVNDIYSQFFRPFKNHNKLEQSMKKSFAEQRPALINEVLREATQILHKSSFELLTVQNLKFMSTPGQAGTILNEDDMNNILCSLDQNKIFITNNIIQLLYDKGLFDSFPNKDQAFANYLTFSETYLKEKYGQTISISDGEYYQSDLEYSTK